MSRPTSLPVAPLGPDRRGFLLASYAACAGACGHAALPVADASPDAAVDALVDAPAELAPAPDARPACEEDPWIVLGPVANYPVGTHTVDTTINLIVTRDARGLWVMRRMCNHQFGAVEARSDGTNRCTNTAGGDSSYGAVFDADGTLIRNPRGEPLGTGPTFTLDNYAVRVCEGVVQVNLGSIVPAGTRAPVP